LACSCFTAGGQKRKLSEKILCSELISGITSTPAGLAHLQIHKCRVRQSMMQGPGKDNVFFCAGEIKLAMINKVHISSWLYLLIDYLI
jgi:hypothetical protein